MGGNPWELLVVTMRNFRWTEGFSEAKPCRSGFENEKGGKSINQHGKWAAEKFRCKEGDDAKRGGEGRE
jgi:hypothetical protein